MSTTVSLTKAVDWRVTVGVPAMHRWPWSGQPAPSKEAPTITVSRPQATNEDLSAYVEACGLGEQSAFISVASGP
jgi:hypothetical protein